MQTQEPFTHAWPVLHAAPEPQVHAPPVQESLVAGSHAMQAAPPVPHVAVEGGLQVLPVQHPLVHDEVQLVHAPLTHWPPPEQMMHTAPPVPQLVLEGVSHAFPLQQPVGQDVALHTHRPPTHACPLPHAAPLPQVHAPALLHPSDVAGLQAVHIAPPMPQDPCVGGSHVLPLQQPIGQDEALQTHVPPPHT